MSKGAATQGRVRLPAPIWVLAAVAFCIALGFGVMSPILPVYAREFGVGGFLIGLVVSSLSMLRLATMPLASAFLRRVGPREMAMVGAVLIAVTTTMMGLSDSYLGLLLWRGLSGFGSAMYGVSSMSLLFANAPEQLRGRANSLYSGGFVLGAMSGPTLGGLLSGVNIHFPFFFYAATLVAAAIVLLVFLPATPPAARKKHVASSVKLAEAFGDARFRATLTMSFANGWQSNGVRALVVPLFVVETLGLTPVSTGIAFAIAATAQALCLPLVGWAVDNVGRRRMLMFGALIAAITGAFFLLANSLVSLIILLCVYAVGASSAGSASQALLADTVPATAGSSLSAYQMFGDAGLILGPMVAGFVMDAWSMEAAVVIGSVLFLVAGAMAWAAPHARLPMLGPAFGTDEGLATGSA